MKKGRFLVFLFLFILKYVNIMKNVIYILIIFILIVINLYQYSHNKNNRIEINNLETIRQDTLIVRDTLKFYKPKPIYVKSELDTLYINDTTFIELPKETKVYRDSTYEARISGFQPNLDHIYVYPKEIYVTTEKVSYIEKKKHFNHGIQLGVGYGVINMKPDVYVGYGFTYTF